MFEEYQKENYSPDLINLIRNFCQVTYTEYLTMIDGIRGKRRKPFFEAQAKRYWHDIFNALYYV